MMKAIRYFVLAYASGFGTGFWPGKGSGTVATALAIPLYFWLLHPLNVWGAGMFGYAFVVGAVFVAGAMASTEAERIWGEKDPGRVTIDEIAGYFISVFLVPISFWSIAVSFIVFRFFDIWKPPIIHRFEKIPGGPGIMLDDAVAGLFTCAICNFVFRILFPS